MAIGKQRNQGHGLAVIIGMGKPPGMAAEDGGGAPGAPDRRRQHAADVEAAFLGKPQPHGTFDAEHDGGKVTAATAGYMELDGARKDGECNLVAVAGGVSGERGCCNLFEPAAAATEFRCGECEHFTSEAAAPAQPAAQGA
jgi:hypothetical protein